MRASRILPATLLIGALGGGAAWADGCPAGSAVCYAYDAFGRLVTVTYANGTVLAYTYDNTDNTLTKTVTCSGTGC